MAGADSAKEEAGVVGNSSLDTAKVTLELMLGSLWMTSHLPGLTSAGCRQHHSHIQTHTQKEGAAEKASPENGMRLLKPQKLTPK